MAGDSNNYDKFSDFERITAYISDYFTAWDITFDLMAPIHDAIRDLFWSGGSVGVGVSGIFIVVLLIGLSIGMYKLDVAEMTKTVGIAILCAFLMIGTTVPVPGVMSNVVSGNAQAGMDQIGRSDTDNNGNRTINNGTVRVAWSIYYVNKYFDEILKYMFKAVDAGIGSFGKSGDFGSPIGAATAMHRGSYASMLKDSRLQEAYSDYITNCSHLATQIGKDDAVRVGLVGGVLGKKLFNAIGFRTDPPKNATDILRDYALKGGDYNKDPGYYLESADYWKERMARTRAENTISAPTVLRVNDKNELMYKNADGSELSQAQRDETKYQFFATNCYHLYLIADIGMESYNKGVYDNFSTMGYGSSQSLLGKGKDEVIKFFMGNTAVSSSMAHYYLQNNLTTNSAEKTGGAANTFRDIKNTVTSWVTGSGDSGATWWQSVRFDYFAAVMPALAAAATALIFILFPIATAFAVLPNRWQMVGLAFWGVLYVKFTVFISYTIIKIGGLLSSTATEIALNSISGTGTNLASSLVPWSLGAQIATFLSAFAASPIISYMLVFGDSSGLKSMTYNKISPADNAAKSAAVVMAAAKTIGPGAMRMAGKAGGSLMGSGATNGGVGGASSSALAPTKSGPNNGGGSTISSTANRVSDDK